MQDVFSSILALSRKLREHLINNNTNTEHFITDLSIKLGTQITKFQREIRSINVNVLDFVQDNQAHLFYIHESLAGVFCKTYVRENASLQTLRGIHDRLFTACLNIRHPKRRFTHLATWISGKFCKGITYFEDDIEYDEGPKTRTSTEKFIDSPSELKKIYVRNCYIERRIYDLIYTNTMHRQDIAHLYELKVIEKIYQDYYPNEYLSINLKFFDDDIMPCCLEISVEQSDYKRTLEIFTRSKNSDIVHCKKVMPNGKIYEKTQTGKHEESYIEV